MSPIPAGCRPGGVEVFTEPRGHQGQREHHVNPLVNWPATQRFRIGRGIKRCTPPIRTISRHIECTTANDASATMTAHLVPSIDGHSAWMLRAGASAISRSVAEGCHAIVDRAVEKVNNLLTGAPRPTRDVTNDRNQGCDERLEHLRILGRRRSSKYS